MNVNVRTNHYFGIVMLTKNHIKCNLSYISDYPVNVPMTVCMKFYSPARLNGESNKSFLHYGMVT